MMDEELIAALPTQADLYQGVMNELSLNLLEEGARFNVRLWDGMDGCWTDLAEATDVDADTALRVWNARTLGGSRKVSFREIDYYRIFPGGTSMVWDGSEDREMFRTK